MCAKLFSEPQIALDMLGLARHAIPRGTESKSSEKDQLIRYMPVYGRAAGQVLQQRGGHEPTNGL